MVRQVVLGSPVPSVHTDRVGWGVVVETERLITCFLLIVKSHELVGSRDETCTIVLLNDEQQTICLCFWASVAWGYRRVSNRTISSILFIIL